MRRQWAVARPSCLDVRGREEEEEPETPFLPPLAISLLRPEVWSGEAEPRACLCCLCEFLSSEIFNFCLLSPDGRGASLCYNLLEAPGPRHSDQSGRKQGVSHAGRLGPLGIWLPLLSHSPAGCLGLVLKSFKIQACPQGLGVLETRVLGPPGKTSWGVSILSI